MNSKPSCFTIFFIIQYSAIKLAESEGGDKPHWTYEYDSIDKVRQDERWAKDFPTCNKSNQARQSPIHLLASDRRPPESDLLFSVSYFSELRGIWTNDGHSLKWALTHKMGLKRLPYVTGGPLKNKKYIFAQFHLHWGENMKHGAEHIVRNRVYPAELHMVHYSSEYASLNEAVQSGEGDAVAVFAIFQAHQPAKRDNPLWEDLSKMDIIPMLFEPGSQWGGEPLKLANILGGPQSLHRYFHYEGSLTTPSCDAVVQWIVFHAPNRYNMAKLLRQMRSLKSQDSQWIRNNFRPVQPTGSRSVVLYTTSNDMFRP